MLNSERQLARFADVVTYKPYRISFKPHNVSKPIDTVMELFDIPGLHSAITLFCNHGISGAFPHRDDYGRSSLPAGFNDLDIWTHMAYTLSPPNEFYEPELRRLRCKPARNDTPPLYDPILVQVTHPRTAVTGVCTFGCSCITASFLTRSPLGRRVADLRLIFRAAQDVNGQKGHVLGYVHWYSPPERPHRDHKLQAVRKMMRGVHRAGGVIELDHILGPCPLASLINGACPPDIDQHNAFDKLTSFYINPYAAHLDYDIFR